MSKNALNNLNWIIEINTTPGVATSKFVRLDVTSLTFSIDQDEEQYGLHGELFKYNFLGQKQLSGSFTTIFDKSNALSKELFSDITLSKVLTKQRNVKIKLSLLDSDLNAVLKTIEFDSTLRNDGDVVGDASSRFELTFNFMSNGSPTLGGTV